MRADFPARVLLRRIRQQYPPVCRTPPAGSKSGGFAGPRRPRSARVFCTPSGARPRGLARGLPIGHHAALLDHPITLGMPALKARGWSPAMIRRLVGEPDRLAPNPRARSAAPARLYAVERVEAITPRAQGHGTGCGAKS